MSVAPDLAAHNGCDTHLHGDLDKEDESIEPVGIGQGVPVHVMGPGALAELLEGRQTPAFGKMGMNVEVDKRHLFYSRFFNC
jgi:hypothetical protein